MIFYVHHMFIISLSYVYQIFISVSREFANCNGFASQQVRVCKTGTQSPSGPRPRAGSKGSHRLGAWRISSCAPASETLLTYDGIYVCASCTCSFAWPCCVYESNIIHNHPQSGSIRIGTLGHIKAWESHMPQDASRLLCSARLQQSARPTLRRVSC